MRKKPSDTISASEADHSLPIPRERAVADARYLFRRAFRLVDEEAKKVGLDALQNQLLIQLRGAVGGMMSVSELAVRLDIPAGLTSRIIRSLEALGLITRNPSAEDGRVTLVRATPEGMRLTEGVAQKSRRRFEELKETLSLERRKAALRIWHRNFGLED